MKELGGLSLLGVKELGNLQNLFSYRFKELL